MQNHLDKEYLVVPDNAKSKKNINSQGEEFHTGEWISNKIIQQMKAIGVQKFSAVITDIASVMKSAWRRIEEKYSNVVCLRCNSHVINLLIGDVLKIDEIKTIVENSKMIVSASDTWFLLGFSFRYLVFVR
ncbi:hypothetical protein RhiirB3_395259 [Rhizophagus irregularis]|nr:hypothetical protein RhiirB3_395259 [Rhizophagus irregularis]